MTFRAVPLLAAVSLLSFPSVAYATNWVVVPEASSIGIQALQTNTPFQAEFTAFSADITLDPADLANASISVTIDTASFESGAPDRDSTVDGAEWFDIAAFPQATFTSTTVTNIADNQYVAAGTLSIKGVSQPVELPFTLDIVDGRAVADGTLALNRLNYGVGTGSDWEDGIFVGLDVTVTVHIEATAAQ